MEKYWVKYFLYIVGVIVSLVSCKQENVERNSQKTALDSKFFNDWYADSIDTDTNISQGVLEYTITANSITKTGVGAYEYSNESTILLANGVYQVEASSTSGDFFYLKEGKSDNEIMISMKNPNSSFERVCQDSYLCMIGLPKSYVFDSWHKLGSEKVYYNLGLELDTLLINDVKHIEPLSVQFNNDYFRLTSARDANGQTTDIYFRQQNGLDSIAVSQSDSLSFDTYYRYSGISVGRVEQDNGIVLSLQSGANWEEQENNSKIAALTEKSRTDWTIILVNDDGSGEIEIDVKNRVVNRINKDGSRTKLTTITSLSNMSVVNGKFIST